MKKGWIKCILGALFLISCWVIGQARNEKNSSSDIDSNLTQNQRMEQITIIPNTDNLENMEEKEKNQEDVIDENMWIEESLEFEGNIPTEDNPWHTTAGYITVEDEKYIFLTPNTSVYLNDIEANNELVFSCGIYSSMREYSDGAGLLIWVLDEEDNILYEEELLVSNEKEWIDCSLLLSQFDGVKRIKILCNNGLEDDDSGDWIFIK